LARLRLIKSSIKCRSGQLLKVPIGSAFYGTPLSLPILSRIVQLKKPRKDEEDAKKKLAAKLEKKGFKFSLEDEQIKYEDFFNEAKISTRNNDTEIIYSISITPKYIAAIVISLLLAIIPGTILVAVWYLKYSKLKDSVESTLDNLSQTP
jgi:hypothetical protein